MATGLLGVKLGMTQAFDDGGELHPLTVIEAGPCVVVQIKTKETDGYNAVCVGFMETDLRKVNKPQSGLYKKVLGEKTKTGFRKQREFRVGDVSGFTVGQALTVEQFNPGDIIDVSGTSKGKGFAGNIKRHHHGRGPMTHGSKNKREAGSTGNNTTPGRVIKGRPMPGQLGNKSVTVQRLRVFQVDLERNLLFVVGAVPGAKRGLVTVKPSVKA